MKKLHSIIIAAWLTLSFFNASAQEAYEPDFKLLPKKIEFPSFTLTYKSYDIFGAYEGHDENLAGLEIEGKKTQALFYGISCREKVSLREIKTRMEKVASMISKYIRDADSNVVNTRYVVLSIGVDKYNDSFLRGEKHLSFILTTTDHKLRRWYYNYSLFDADTALTDLYDIDYIKKLTGADMAKRKKIYYDMSVEVGACAVKKADAMIGPPLKSITDKPEDDEHQNRTYVMNRQDLIEKSHRSCFEAAIRSRFRITMNRSLMEYLYSEWCLYRKFISY